MLRKSQYRDMEKFKRTKREQHARYYHRTQDAPNSRQRWTCEEIELLMQKSMPDRELSEKIGRSMKAIITKRHKVMRMGGEKWASKN